MATLIELSESGRLVKIDPLEDDEQPWRSLYATLDFIAWLDAALPELEGDELYSSLSPIEQVWAVFHEYVSGEDFASDRRFKKLSATPDHFVWEIKTDDVRVFGWVPSKDVFVCCFGGEADHIKLMGSYGAYIARTAYVRGQMDLNEPKCCQSKDYKDVLSAKN